MTAPVWQAATTGSPALAGHVNQFLVTHAVTAVYQGQQQASAAAGSGSTASDNLWIAQQVTTAAGQTAAGWVTVDCAFTGAPPPWVLSWQADNGSGAPSGVPLASTPLPSQFAAGTLASVPVMLPVSGLTAGAPYWLVASPAGDLTDNFTWGHSAASSGASTSPDGVTWTAQTYGLAFAVFDASPVSPLAGTWEDSGARWTSLLYSGAVLASVSEFTAGQSAAGYTASVVSLSFAGNKLTGVT